MFSTSDMRKTDTSRDRHCRMALEDSTIWLSSDAEESDEVE